ncbi:PREDICTED: fatty acid hydroxylase domain-containing protein 2 [Capra hircus]|uniref:fatty acid hydroxylase domain-containing protein 2 n=1 Tax=Capra hircus TaxID=9925 RepID=UPI0008470B4E|nr:PREDICTED: fatty acid hydroxylase domain-containing protein 2 [Capra hircus]
MAASWRGVLHFPAAGAAVLRPRQTVSQDTTLDRTAVQPVLKTTLVARTCELAPPERTALVQKATEKQGKVAEPAKRGQTGWREGFPGAATVALDPVFSSPCPGSGPRTERPSEMGALGPRAASRTAPKQPGHTALPIRSARLACSFRVASGARAPDSTRPSLSARPGDPVRVRPTCGLAGASRERANGRAGRPRTTHAEYRAPPAFALFVVLVHFINTTAPPSRFAFRARSNEGACPRASLLPMLRDVSGAKRTRQIFVVRAVRSRPSLGSFKARTCPLIIRESCLERELFANSYSWQLDRARICPLARRAFLSLIKIDPNSFSHYVHVPGLSQPIGLASLPAHPSTSRKGHSWGSMRRMAFILGSSLLLLMIHWNCVIGHFQRFWGASSYFWQAQWERLLSTFEGKEWLLYVLGVTQVPLLVYWPFSGLLLVVETGKPNFISRYRIQVDNNGCVDPMKPRQALLMILFNQFVISLPMLVSLYPILKLWGHPCHRELPTFHWFLLELVIFTLTEEVLFCYSHSFLHHPKLHKKIRKKHHEWTVPITATCLSVHPIEHVVSRAWLPQRRGQRAPIPFLKLRSPAQNGTTVGVSFFCPFHSYHLYWHIQGKARCLMKSSWYHSEGRGHPPWFPSSPQSPLRQLSPCRSTCCRQTVMGSHLPSITTWTSLALIFTVISHCGYHLPFLPSPEFHDYHHQKVDQCYAALGMLDYHHGTDIVFRQTKAYKRHMILLGFTPLSESIPDPLKMTD